MSGEIPIIDVTGLRSGDPAAAAEAAKRLEAACGGIGFFYVTGHGIPPQVIADAFRSAEDFFALPLDTKMSFAMATRSRCFRGYSPVLSELADGKRNAYELLEFSVDLGEQDPDVVARKPMHGPNVWPDLRDFRRRVSAYVEHQVGLGFDLMRGIALSLGLPSNYFREAFHDRPFWQFRTVSYPESADVQDMSRALDHDRDLAEIEVGSYNCGAHTDYGCLTILLADKPGLQVLPRGRTWFDAPAIPGAYICNIGDMLQYWTNGRYVATRHRVLTAEPRISLPFFFQPDYETVVRPTDIDGASEKPPIVYGPYAFEKYKGIYPACRC